MSDLTEQIIDAQLPTEFTLDPDHPANDQYMKSIAAMRRQVVAQSMQMKPAHVEAVKLQLAGQKHIDIAERLNLTPGAITTILRRPDAVQLREMLRHLATAIDGPNEMQRRAMLWRIARRTEEEDPRVAIASLAELNRMTGATSPAPTGGAGGQGGPQINIIINEKQYPKGVLDQ